MEDTLCLTGGADGAVRLWDLRVVEDYEERMQKASDKRALHDPLERILERQEDEQDYDWEEGPSGFTDMTMNSNTSMAEESGPCVRVLEGHSKSVTALCYEDGTLVSRSLLGLKVKRPDNGLGDWIIGQDDPTMGCLDRTMRIDNGYPMGDCQPSNGAHTPTQTA